jgi:general secretion pathway protein N
VILRKRRNRKLWAPTAAHSGWNESTYAELAWDRSRGAAKRWAIAGGIVGAIAALIAFAPAAWLASAIESATGARVMLADARGTVWSGSAVAVLTAGAGSRDASALPGRLEWTLAPKGFGAELRLRHACCINGTQALQVRPGFGRVQVVLPPASGWLAQWPAGLLNGLGTPFNTMDLGGAVRLTTPGMTLETVQGRWRVNGRADVDLLGVSSRISPLPTLGSYRLSFAGDAGGAGAQINLSTQEGALQLSGSGSMSGAGLRFRGEARAGEGQEAALNNLLNIIGRRDGARSVISIG